MIDYQKLKLAHELVEEYAELNRTCTSLSVTVRFLRDDEIEYQFDFSGTDENEEIESTTLDDLIAKLQELGQPKSKYNAGQKVWSYTYGQMSSWKIDSIKWEPDLNDFRVNVRSKGGKASLLESQLYSTKAQLIEAQIEYWQSQREYQPPFEGEVKSFREIHPAPFKGKLTKEQIEKAVNYVPKCQHESTGDLHHLADGKLYHTCDKCDDYFIKCEHEPDYSAITIYPTQKCLKCGEFYR